MLIPDVNIYLAAFSANDPHNERLRSWLTAHLSGAEQFGVSELVLSAVVRIATNHRVYPKPATPDEAVAFCAMVRSAGAAIVVSPGSRHWGLFAGLVHETQARASAVPDAYLAALALENGATFVTRDRGFARFPGLRVLDPLAS